MSNNNSPDLVVNIFQKGILIGTLRHEDATNKHLVFQYDALWLNDQNAEPISEQFPLTHKKFHGEKVDAFFENFLPEGGRRKFIQTAFHISSDNTLRMLAHFGGDTAGSLVFLPDGQTFDSASRYHRIPEDALDKWFYEAYTLPAATFNGKRAHASLSGMQAKIALFVDKDGDFFLPIGCAPSNCIIKPSPRHNVDMPEAAINEALVMRLAKAIGMNVPETRFLPRINAFVIARYDRKETPDGGLQRLNQNDFCQILGVGSNKKYEADNGPTFKDCIEVIEQISSHPERDRNRLIEWAVFNLAIGNMDSHAKNISMLDTGEGWELAPFYDLFCTTVYRASTEFAFKIGGEFRPENITEQHWERFSSEVGVTPEYLRALRIDVCSRIAKELPAICNELKEQAATREQHERMVKMAKRVEKKILLTSQSMMKAAQMHQAQPELAEDTGLVLPPKRSYESCAPGF